jgi:hypothetical protein
MKKMTYVTAIENAINNNLTAETIERLTALRDTLKKRAEAPRWEKSQAQKDKENAVRREKNQKARALLMETVIPILTDAMSVNDDYTAVEIYERAKDNLPDNFTANKVQAVLLREMRPNVVITEKKNCPNHYRLA